MKNMSNAVVPFAGHPEASGWAPSEIKELTPGPMGPPVGPPMGMGQPLGPPHIAPPHMMSAPPYVSPYRPHPPPHMHERDRDRDRDRVRERDDRDRRDRDRRDEVSYSLHFCYF